MQIKGAPKRNKPVKEVGCWMATRRQVLNKKAFLFENTLIHTKSKSNFTCFFFAVFLDIRDNMFNTKRNTPSQIKRFGNSDINF